ncbi:DNA topoisomerase 2-beta [Dermatophagoides farinae]|uniref:DNA topoisomerase (ATP-hydrolyzing) n=1 Tax=Dermatophagoides farinae TaxID=6954 RepID=A0A922I7U1_DERFA|nr:DNA topoisomerase 2-beta [Dermatophagoides farinae]
MNNGQKNIKLYETKYNKGLGGVAENDIKKYFSNIKEHRIKLCYMDNNDDDAIEMAFNPVNWINKIQLYEQDTREISYKDFICKALLAFCIMKNGRSISSLMDGLKPVQRKIIHTCFKLYVSILSGATNSMQIKQRDCS